MHNLIYLPPKNDGIVSLKGVNFVVCKLYFNKVVKINNKLVVREEKEQ